MPARVDCHGRANLYIADLMQRKLLARGSHMLPGCQKNGDVKEMHVGSAKGCTLEYRC
ncbi:hypothetical protein PILCRDRAFT_811023 [Piloderma croceum F 1598]|uniref:Uncharacterized protein n=1 Tax=Piloderma croceum (strain F 1598) TaxID=765440 RepID=A0A0C3GJB4_PILCF|nr:hypothetical protein PILCRDRAFT_811023 [Piloderma croceum F 1598]